MKPIRLIVLAAALAAAGSAQAQFFNLAGTGVQGIYGLSFDGTRAVGYGPQGGNYFRWELGAGTLNIGGVFESGAPRISDDGSTLLINALNPATSLIEMARHDWASGTTTPLGSLGSSSGNSASSGWGLSGNGQVAVGLGWVTAGRAEAMVVSGNTVSSLGTTVPGRSTRANNASFDGSTIVGWQDSSTGFRQGAVWSGGTQTLMVDANGNLMGELGDVSADGTWAVGSGVSSNGFVAYRWSAATGVQTLGPNLVPGDRSSATGISNDGSVIVGFSRPLGPATFGRGFIWSEGTGMLNLNTVAAAQGINTGGVIMALPLTISGDGLTVGGVTNAGSGFILRLTSPIPEPSTMLSMAFGVLALAGWALRRNRGAASAAV